MLTVCTGITAFGQIVDMVGVVILTLDLLPEYREYRLRRIRHQTLQVMVAPIDRYFEQRREPGDFLAIHNFDFQKATPERVAELWRLGGIQESEWSTMKTAVQQLHRECHWPYPVRNPASSSEVFEEWARWYLQLNPPEGEVEYELAFRVRFAIGWAGAAILAGFFLQLGGTISSGLWCS
jgi:hypothetical protein